MDTLRSLQMDSRSRPKGGSGRSLNIDGGTALSKTRRGELPVVLLPVFREFAPGLQDVVDLVHALQQVSLAFRVVAITDLGDFSALRSHGWTIVHVSTEASWDTKRKSWVQYVRDEAIAAVANFSCVHVLDVQNRRLADASWNFLLALCRLDMEQPVGRDDSVISSHSVHYSWRGWVGEVPAGESNHELRLQGGVWTASIYRANTGSIVLIDADPAQKVSPEIFGLAVRRGWNTCKLVCNEGTGSSTQRELIISALFDGLSLESAGVSSYSSKGDSQPRDAFKSGMLPTIGRADLLSAERRAIAKWSVRVWAEGFRDPVGLSGAQ